MVSAVDLVAARHSGAQRRRSALCWSVSAQRRVQSVERTCTRAVEIQFKLPYRTQYGQSLSIVGSNELLGGWDVSTRVPMEWTEGDVWEATVRAETLADSLEYKYIIVDQDGFVSQWKPGGNFVLEVDVLSGKVLVSDTWDGSHDVVAGEQQPVDDTAPTTSDEPDTETEEEPEQASAAIVDSPSDSEEPAAPEVTAVDDDEQVLKLAVKRAYGELEQTLSASLELVHEVDPTDPRLLMNDQKLAAVHKKATSLSKALEAGSPPPAYILKQLEKDKGEKQKDGD